MMTVFCQVETFSCDIKQSCVRPQQCPTVWTYLWHEVSKPDRRHGNEDKVEGLEKSPVLPGPVYDGSHEDVHQKDKDGHGNWQVEFIVYFKGAERRCAWWFVPFRLLCVRGEGHLQLHVLRPCDWRPHRGCAGLVDHLTGAPKSGEVVHKLYTLHDFLQGQAVVTVVGCGGSYRRFGGTCCLHLDGEGWESDGRKGTVNGRNTKTSENMS